MEENRPIRVRLVPVAELDQLELRRKVPEGVAVARIVSVRDFDAIAVLRHARALDRRAGADQGAASSERVKQLAPRSFQGGAARARRLP